MLPLAHSTSNTTDGSLSGLQSNTISTNIPSTSNSISTNSNLFANTLEKVSTDCSILHFPTSSENKSLSRFTLTDFTKTDASSIASALHSTAALRKRDVASTCGKASLNCSHTITAAGPALEKTLLPLGEGAVNLVAGTASKIAGDTTLSTVIYVVAPNLDPSALQETISAGQTTLQNILHATPDVVNTTCNSVSIVINSALIVYHLIRLEQEKSNSYRLKENYQALNTLAKKANDLNSEEIKAIHSAQEVVERLRTYNNKSANARRAIILGSAVITSGTACALTGAGSPVTLPLYALGTPLTIGGTAYKRVVEQKKSRFVGKTANAEAKRLAESEGIWSEEKELRNIIKPENLQTAAQIYSNIQKNLVRTKLFSLMLHVLTTEKYEAWQAILEKTFSTGAKNFFHQTTLLKTDLELMQALYQEEGWKELLNKTKVEITQQMLTQLLPDGQLKKIIEHQLRHHHTKRLAQLISQIKTDLEFLRVAAANSLVRFNTPAVAK